MGKQWGIKYSGRRFETGVYFTPSGGETRYMLGVLHEKGLYDFLVPEVDINAVMQDRAALNGVIPVIIERAEARKLYELAPADMVKAILWVFACYAHKWLRWPFPGTIKKKPLSPRAPTRRFICPYCGHEWEPNPHYKDRKVILKQYSTWIRTHPQCHSGDAIHLAEGMK